MASLFSPEQMDYYRTVIPVLSEPGWEETGATGYGKPWWSKPIQVDHPDITAQLTVVIRPAYAEIFLNLRHPYNLVARADLGYSGQDWASLEAKVAKELPQLKALILDQYRMAIELENKYG